jgi:hypothetical protein
MEFERLLPRLLEHKIEFILVGGFAANLHGTRDVTQDIDICLKLSRENLARLSAALTDLHPVHRLTPNRLPLQITDANWQSFKNIYLETDWGVLDCLGEVAGIGDYEKAVPLSTHITLPIGECPVLTIEALIHAKETMARPHDLRTVAALKAIASHRNKKN